MPLSAQIKVLAFAGSTRADSFNKKLVKEAAEIAKSLNADVTYIDLKDFPIPLYEGDLEAASGMPDQAQRIRNLMIDAQVIVIASPENNGSVSALLKNVIDWASRSESGQPSRAAFKDKTFVLLSASPGKKGGATGLVHLQAILQNLGGIVHANQLSLPEAHNQFDSQGKLKDPEVRIHLLKLVETAVSR